MATLPSAPESVFFRRRCDLHVVIEWVVNMEAAVAPCDVEPFRFERRAHARLVPVRNGVADVVDHGLRPRLYAGAAAGSAAGVARDQERTAFAGLRPEHQICPLAVIPCGLALHAENRCVPVACLGVIRASIGHVVDADDLETALGLGLRGIARAIDRSGERHGLAEFATIDLAAVQALNQISDEAFHVRPPCPASPRRRSSSRLAAYPCGRYAGPWFLV